MTVMARAISGSIFFTAFGTVWSSSFIIFTISRAVALSIFFVRGFCCSVVSFVKSIMILPFVLRQTFHPPLCYRGIIFSKFAMLCYAG